jgi:hypothetical protein
MELDQRYPVKGSRSIEGPINPSVSKGSTEVEPSGYASASSGRTDRRRNGLRTCFSAVNCSSAAGFWCWNRSTTSRRVKAWVASGQLVRTAGPDSRSVFTARTRDVPQVCDAVATFASPSAKSLVTPMVCLPVQSVAQGEHPWSGSCSGSAARIFLLKA